MAQQQNRDQTLFVNVTRAEKLAMEKIAGKHGGLSAWARGVLIEETEFVSKVLPAVKRHFKAEAKKKNGGHHRYKKRRDGVRVLKKPAPKRAAKKAA